jgi:hypothetical protein
MRTSIVIGMLALILVVGVVLLVPIIPTQEQYQEPESYERLASYEVPTAVLSSGFDLSRGYFVISEVSVKNIDSYAGTFQVTHRLYTVDGLFGTKTTNEYISPGDTKTSRAEFDTRLGQDVRGEYSVSPPTVIAQRVVTKTRTVYRSIFEILTRH